MLRTRIAKAAAVAALVIVASLSGPATATAFLSEADAAATSSVLADAGWQVAPADAGWQ